MFNNPRYIHLFRAVIPLLLWIFVASHLYGQKVTESLIYVYIHPFTSNLEATPSKVISDFSTSFSQRFIALTDSIETIKTYDPRVDTTAMFKERRFEKVYCKQLGICEDIQVPKEANTFILGSIKDDGNGKVLIEFTMIYLSGEQLYYNKYYPKRISIEKFRLPAVNAQYCRGFVNDNFGKSSFNQIIRRFKEIRLKTSSEIKALSSSKTSHNLSFNDLDTLKGRTEQSYNNYRSTQDEEKVPDLERVAEYHKKDAGYLLFEVDMVLHYLKSKGYIENVQKCLKSQTRDINSYCWDREVIKLYKDSINKNSANKDSLIPKLRTQGTMENINQFDRYINFDAGFLRKDAKGNYCFIKTNWEGKIEWEQTWYKELLARKNFLCDGFLDLCKAYLKLEIPSKSSSLDVKIKWIQDQVKNGNIPNHKTLSQY